MLRPEQPADRLAAEAARAARVRALSTDPDVIALRVERVRVQVDRLMWSGIVLGLGFTMTNVQAFAAGGAPPWSTPWVAAWALDPMVSLVLIAVLRAEQVTARWQVRTGPWVRRARWGTLAATYIMNTWSAWADGIPSQVVLHSVPPLVVFAAAEAVTGLREALSDAVHAAAGAAQGQDRADGRGAIRSASTVAAAVAAPGDADVLASAVERGPVDPVDPADTSPATGVDAAITPEPTPVDVDRRVRELADLRAAGCPVTGAHAAVIYAVSARTGRRLLSEAKALLSADDLDPEPPDAGMASAEDGQARPLSLVAAPTQLEVGA